MTVRKYQTSARPGDAIRFYAGRYDSGGNPVALRGEVSDVFEDYDPLTGTVSMAYRLDDGRVIYPRQVTR